MPFSPFPPTCPAQLHRLGKVFYGAGLRMQAGIAARVKQGILPDQLLVLEHMPVFTLGRNATRRDIHVNDDFLGIHGVEVHQADRGGQVTYHGPGQIVAYPICHLQGRQTLKGFVSALEQAMIDCAADFGVVAQRLEGFPGVWVNTPRGFEKLGALGIHLKQWVSTHGIAFNVRPDLAHFRWITPCGITDKGVCSLASLLGDQAPSWHVAADSLSHHLVHHLGWMVVPSLPQSRSVSNLIWRRCAGQKEVLMMLRQPSYGLWWSSVTGMIEPGETPEAAALREAQEETGLTGRLNSFAFDYSFWLDPAILHYAEEQMRFNHEYCFHMEVAPEDQVDLCMAEHSEYQWCSVQTAESLVPWEGAKAMLRKLASLP